MPLAMAAGIALVTSAVVPPCYSIVSMQIRKCKYGLVGVTYHHGVQAGTGETIVSTDKVLCGFEETLEIGLLADGVAISFRGAVVESLEARDRRQRGCDGEEGRRTHGDRFGSRWVLVRGLE